MIMNSCTLHPKRVWHMHMQACTQHMHTAHSQHMKPLCSVMVRVQIKCYMHTAHTDVTYTIHTHTYTSHTHIEQHTLILNVIGLDMIGSLAKHKPNSKMFRPVSSSCHQKTTDVDHWIAAKMFDIQWNPSIADTMGPPLRVWIIEASIFQRLPVYFQ